MQHEHCTFNTIIVSYDGKVNVFNGGMTNDREALNI